MPEVPVLGVVGPRLRALRQQRGATLASVSAATGISVSTLSRLESGGRKPTLELLLALSRAYQVPLDELVGVPPPGDPRVRARPVRRHGRTLVPLTQRPGGLRAYKMLLPPAEPEAELRTHEGYEWMYVLSGRVRLRLADLDFVMKAGEAAEFDTRTPHWFGSAGPEPAEMLVLFGPQGERMHIRARPRTNHRAHMTSAAPADHTRSRSANYAPLGAVWHSPALGYTAARSRRAASSAGPSRQPGTTTQPSRRQAPAASGWAVTTCEQVPSRPQAPGAYWGHGPNHRDNPRRDPRHMACRHGCGRDRCHAQDVSPHRADRDGRLHRRVARGQAPWSQLARRSRRGQRDRKCRSVHLQRAGSNGPFHYRTAHCSRTV